MTLHMRRMHAARNAWSFSDAPGSVFSVEEHQANVGVERRQVELKGVEGGD